MVDDFEFQLIDNFPGYISSKDPTNVTPGALIRGSQNVIKKISGTLAARFGLKQFGAADGSINPVRSSFEWNTSLGNLRPLRVLNDGTLEFMFNGIWYLLQGGLFSNRVVFDTWWDAAEAQDILVFCVGDSNMYSWFGGVSIIGTTTSTTITKQNSTTTWGEDGFNAGGGTIIINGHSYGYTGITSDGLTLTGVTGDPTGEAAGSIIFIAIIITSNTPASGFSNDFLKTIGNQVYVGSYSSRLIYISGDGNESNGDYRTYSVPTPRVPGSPELLTLNNNVVGIGIKDGNANIFAGISDRYIIVFSNLVVNTVATQQTDVTKEFMGNLFAPLAHEFIDSIGNDIAILSQDNQLRLVGTFKDIFGNDKYPSLSQELQDELTEVDFSGGHLRSISEYIYITSPKTGTHYLYQSRESVNATGLVQAERLWHPPQVCNISRIALIDGIIYGHSNANPMMYQVWDTDQWHDDSTSGSALPYNAVAFIAYGHLGQKQGNRRQGLANFDKAFFEGYISQNTNLYGNVFFDYQGASSLQNVIINTVKSPTNFFTGELAPSLGDFSLGDNPLGDGLVLQADDQALLPKFLQICNINPVNCFEWALQVYSSDPDSRWELLSIGVNARIAEQQASFIRK